MRDSISDTSGTNLLSDSCKSGVLGLIAVSLAFFNDSVSLCGS